jgi:hypothetical protein
MADLEKTGFYREINRNKSDEYHRRQRPQQITDVADQCKEIVVHSAPIIIIRRQSHRQARR